MFKKFFRGIIDFVKEEWVFLVTVITISIICCWPVNYYIVIGGGISDVGDRIEVDKGYDGKGSFNLSYVSELKGTTVSYLLSFVVPGWERLGIDYYQYNETDSFDDIAFRGDLSLKNANSVAIKNAYDLAKKKCVVKNINIFVIAKFDEYESDLKIKDQIISINGKKFNSTQGFIDYLQGFKAGDKVSVKVLRNNKELEVTNTLYELDGRIILGIGLDYYYELDTDPDVKIKFEGDESGPSAGLMTTLEIYNQLTKEDITKGKVVAGTGTIEEDGTVGGVGGISHKVFGAASGGAEVFLVPKGSYYEEAIKTKKEKKLDIEIYEVATVKEAIEILKKI